VTAAAKNAARRKGVTTKMSKMTKTKLAEILRRRVNAEVEPGYNYCLMTLRCATSEVEELMTRLRQRKEGIEEAYKQRVLDAPEDWSLLPYVCVRLERGVWIPIPFQTELNTLSAVLVELLPDVEFSAPEWS